jgi:capsular polysaccharide biosynthesis protein
MTDESIPTIYTPAEIETRRLILYVRARFWRYLIIVFLLGCYFFYFFKYKVLEYSSTALFMVNDHSFVETSLGFQNLPADQNLNRIFELSNSVMVQKHLIEKFELIKLYNIDTTREFYRQQTLALVRSKILVTRSPMNTISVTVKDSRRYLTAEMANEIVRYVDKLNHDYFVDNISRRLNIAKGYAEEIDRNLMSKTQLVDTLIAHMGIIAMNTKYNEKISYDVLMKQSALGEALTSFKNASNDFVTAQKMYALSLQALNFNNYPTITQVQEAMPAPRSISYDAAFYSCGAMVAIGLLLVIQAYFYLSYKHYIRLLLTGR